MKVPRIWFSMLLHLVSFYRIISKYKPSYSILRNVSINIRKVLYILMLNQKIRFVLLKRCL